MDWKQNKNYSNVKDMHDKIGQQEPIQQDWANYTDMSVGEILRRTRCHYGLSIEDVESALHIRVPQLNALEEGAVERLPGRVYAIGFVRAYAEFLGLDGDKIVHLFKVQVLGNNSRPDLSFPAPASESKLPNPFILIASFAGFCLIVGAFMVMGRTSKTHEIPNVPPALKMAVAAYGPPVDPAILAASIDPAAGTEGAETKPENRVVINVIDNAWIEIRNKEGKAILSRILKKGDSYLVPDDSGMVMDTGNIGALAFIVDGVAIEKLGEMGDVRRSVSLDPAILVPPPVLEEEAVLQDQFPVSVE